MTMPQLCNMVLPCDHEMAMTMRRSVVALQSYSNAIRKQNRDNDEGAAMMLHCYNEISQF